MELIISLPPAAREALPTMVTPLLPQFHDSGAQHWRPSPSSSSSYPVAPSPSLTTLSPAVSLQLWLWCFFRSECVCIYTLKIWWMCDSRKDRWCVTDTSQTDPRKHMGTPVYVRGVWQKKLHIGRHITHNEAVRIWGLTYIPHKHQNDWLCTCMHGTKTAHLSKLTVHVWITASHQHFQEHINRLLEPTTASNWRLSIKRYTSESRPLHPPFRSQPSSFHWMKVTTKLHRPMYFNLWDI